MAKNISIDLQEAQEAVKNLTADLTQANEANKTAAADIKARDEQIVALTAQLADEKAASAKAAEALKGATDELAKATARIAELEANAKTAEQKAGEILANVGVPPVENAATPPAPTAAELLEQYKAISDPKAKNAFYDKHRDILTPKHAQARS